jgi:hypothetical protein
VTATRNVEEPQADASEEDGCDEAEATEPTTTTTIDVTRFHTTTVAPVGAAETAAASPGTGPYGTPADVMGNPGQGNDACAEPVYITITETSTATYVSLSQK